MTKKIISLIVALALAATTITGLSVIFASATMAKPAVGGESGNVLVWDIANWEAYSDTAYRATKNEDDSVTFSKTDDKVIWNGLAGKDGVETTEEALEAGTYYAKLLFKTSKSDDETITKADEEKDTAVSVQLINGETYDFGVVDAELDGKWQSAVIPFEIAEVSDAEMIFNNNWVGEDFEFTIGQYFVISTSEEALEIEYEDDAEEEPSIDVEGETPLLGWSNGTYVAPGYNPVPGQAAETAWAFDIPALFDAGGGASAYPQASKIASASDANMGLIETKPGSAANAMIMNNLYIGQTIQRGTYYLKFMLMGNEVDTVHNTATETANKSNELLQVKLEYSSGSDSAVAVDRAVGTADVTQSGVWQSVVVEFTLDNDWQGNIGKLSINIKNGGTGSKHTVTLSKYVFISTDPKELVREDFEGHSHVDEIGKFSSQPESSVAPEASGILPDKEESFNYEYGQDTAWIHLGTTNNIDDNGTSFPNAAELGALATEEEKQALRRERRIDDVITFSANDARFTKPMITESGVLSGKKYLKFVVAFDNLWDNPYSANATTSHYEMAYFRNELDNKAGRFGNMKKESEGKWQSIVMEIDFEADFPAEKKAASEMNKAITFWFVSLHGQGANVKPDPNNPAVNIPIPENEKFHLYLLNHVVLSDDKTPLEVPKGKREVYLGRHTANPILLGTIEGQVENVLPPDPNEDANKDPEPIVFEDGTKENNSHTVTGRTPTIAGLHAAEVLNEIELGFAQQLAYGVWETFNVASIAYLGLVNNLDDRELSSDGIVTVSIPIPDHALAYASKIKVMAYKYNYAYTATFPHLFETADGSTYYDDMIFENNANLIIPDLSADGKSVVFKTHEAMTTEGLNYVLVVDDKNYRRPGSGANTGEGIWIYVAIGVVVLAIGGAVTLVLLKKKTSKDEE
jgi:hypothetical protein